MEKEKKDWKARHLSASENLPALDPVPEGYRIPSWVNVDDLRRLYCATLAEHDADTDDRIDRLHTITDPLRVLSVVAPYIKVEQVAIEPTPSASPDEPALPVNIGEGGGGTFTAHGTTTETGEVFAATEAAANAIAKEKGGTVKGFD